MNIRNITTLYVIPGGRSSNSSHHHGEARNSGVTDASSKHSRKGAVPPRTRTNVPDLRVLPDCGAEISFESTLEQHTKHRTDSLSSDVEKVAARELSIYTGRRVKCDTVLKRLIEIDLPYDDDLLLAEETASQVIEGHQISESVFDRFAYALCIGKEPALLPLLNQELAQRGSRLRIAYVDQRILTCSPEPEEYFREVIFCTSVGLVDLDKCVAPEDSINPALIPTDSVTIWPIRQVRTVYFSDRDGRLVYQQRRHDFVFNNR
ncbi:MAG: hypothetical protein K2X93_16675 [Candidatus Obscuribacterales bacterium]|nr:hypothetical protein [Candidatus Obscuribacterales bacterium]